MYDVGDKGVPPYTASGSTIAVDADETEEVNAGMVDQ